MKLTQQDKADHLYDALEILTTLVDDSIKQNEPPTRHTALMDRVHYLKENCTIHIQAPRQSGHTTTVFDFIEDKVLEAVYLTSNQDHATQVQEKYGHKRCYTWKTVNRVDFTGVSAIFVDPATHACRKAMHCVYDRAAEQLAITGKPPVIYLIS